MRFILFIALTTLIAPNVFSQDDEKVEMKRFSIGVTAIPEISYRNFTKGSEDFHDTIWNPAEQFVDSIETQKFGSTIGLNVGFRVGNRFEVESGIYYSNKGYRYLPILTQVGWNQPAFMARIRIDHTFLDFPLKVNYIFRDGKLNYYGSVGLVGNLRLKTESFIFPEEPGLYDETSSVDQAEYRNFGLSTYAGFGALIQVNESFSIRIEPSFRYSITSIDNQTYRQIHLWNAGNNFGCKILM
jgi:hypothetical protein